VRREIKKGVTEILILVPIIIKTIDIKKNSRMNSNSLGLGSGEMRVDLKDDHRISAEA